MRLASYHVHTSFCDGKSTPVDMLQAAIDLGMSDLGFTAHAAWPFASEWHLPVPRYAEYLAEIARLKKEYGTRFSILSGFEADYIEGITAPDSAFYDRFNTDFLIGSVHYVAGKERFRGKGPTSGLWSVDAPSDEVARGIESCFGGNGRRAAEAYWGTVRDMIASCDFDIVGHLDVLRKRNGELRFFDESASWYRRELRATVKAIARAGKIVEINTGGIARKAIDSVYPSAEALALLYRAGVPITINSDAHATGDLLCAYDHARDAARRAGYETLTFRNGSGWVQERF